MIRGDHIQKTENIWFILKIKIINKWIVLNFRKIIIIKIWRKQDLRYSIFKYKLLAGEMSQKWRYTEMFI